MCVVVRGYCPGIKVLFGDNLTSHFNAKFVKVAKEHNIFLLCYHQTLLISHSVFDPIGNASQGEVDPFPEEMFPSLRRLFAKMEPTLPNNLKSGFRTCGLYPLDSEAHKS